ncbi:hypothetical protein NCS57_00216800 [Fusarium keratoplasticum]|uniref:Uncharacterized protein n=1 Tax=Fusarium keratoplasticum TaxID=1328300 RepID=A0ACC0R9K5_9HYPO|nr:hypothetical protein NCS57_00216800 [Fusarium keratoplasticum]KAI8679388.1 hypothetical protein NCS57_00216800 [Fusarium keratoplasticum]KAI8685482.1 hypothetical protein NCS55_00220600 [Fusarium keratoplasticum]
MVHTKVLYSVPALQVLAVSAAPADPQNFTPPNKLEAKSSVYYYTNNRWDGECRTVKVNLDACQFNDRISSIWNNVKGAYKCICYPDGNCNGDSYDNQEDVNQEDATGKFNDSVSSFSCHRK